MVNLDMSGAKTCTCLFADADSTQSRQPVACTRPLVLPASHPIHTPRALLQGRIRTPHPARYATHTHHEYPYREKARTRTPLPAGYMTHTPCVSVQAGSAFAAAGISINDTLHNGSLLIATATLTRAPRLVLDHPRVEHACKHRAPRTVSLIIYTYQKCVQCVPIQPCSGAVRRYRTRRCLGRAAQMIPLIFSSRFAVK